MPNPGASDVIRLSIRIPSKQFALMKHFLEPLGLDGSAEVARYYIDRGLQDVMQQADFLRVFGANLGKPLTDDSALAALKQRIEAFLGDSKAQGDDSGGDAS